MGGLAAIGGAAGLSVSAVTQPSRAAVGVFETSYDVNGTFVVGGHPLFLIALSNPPPLDGTTPAGASGLKAVVRTGVNLFRVGRAWSPWTVARVALAKRWDEAAARLGVYTWINLNSVARARPYWQVAARLQRVVLELLTGPTSRGIGLWKGADEPLFRRVSPASLEFAYCRVTSRGKPSWCAGQRPLDEHHLWVTVESAYGSAARLAAYSKVTDTHGVDVYPISINESRSAGRGHRPNLHLVGIWTRRIASVTPNHSVWTTLQVCFSGSYSKRTGRYLMPTVWQERYMVYDAIINGARGIAFFGGDNPRCWNRRDRTRGWNWTFWNSTLHGLIAQISNRSPLARALIEPETTRGLTTNDPTTQAISRSDTTPTGHRELWVLAARSGPNSQQIVISGLPHSITQATIYPGNHPIRITNGTLTDRFRQWQVHIYRFQDPNTQPSPSRKRV